MKRPDDAVTRLLSHNAHVLLCLAEDPHARLREIARRTGITERSVVDRLAELESMGWIARTREGRRNSYEVFLDRPLDHPLERHKTVGDLLRALERGES